MSKKTVKSKTIKSKSGEHNLGFGIFIVFLSIAASLFAFISEDKNVTGAVTAEPAPEDALFAVQILTEFKDIKSLAVLSAGNYYIDNGGVVYWIDDESKPAVAKLAYIDDAQKNKNIYIDNGGRIGYVISAVIMD